MKTICALVLLFLPFWFNAQETSDQAASAAKTEREIGLVLIGFRGYDFSKDYYGVRDKYQFNLAPGVFYLQGNAKKKLRLSLQYTHVGIEGNLHYRTFYSFGTGAYIPNVQYTRQAIEARLGYIYKFNGDEKTPVHLYYATDLTYSYGRQKSAVVFSSDITFGKIIGYQFNSISNLHALGITIDLNSDLTLYAETGFAIDSQFGLRTYYYANTKYFGNRFTMSANYRVLQVGISKKLNGSK